MADNYNFSSGKVAMTKLNCWEFKKCGRGPCSSDGECPAAQDQSLDRVHGGSNAGRTCWVVAGTHCGGEVQGSFAHKIKDCYLCEFYNLVRREEGRKFEPSTSLLRMLRDSEKSAG